MSRSVDLFIDAQVSLDELAAMLGSQSGSPLTAEAGQARWLLQEGETRAALAEHPDGDLPFGRYRFALSARVADDVRPYDTPEAALLRRTARFIQQGPAWPVLLVQDFQYRHPVAAAGAAGIRPDQEAEPEPGAGSAPSAEPSRVAEPEPG